MQSCKKSKNPDHYTISDDLKQWYLYQKGSFWIYKNENTQQIDSLFILNSPTYNQEPIGENDDGSLDAIIDHLTWGYNNSFLWASDLSYDQFLVYNAPYDFNYAFRTFVLEGQRFPLDGLYEYVKHYDSINVNNYFFKNVRLTKYSHASLSGDSITFTFYFSKNIGLIKYIRNQAGIDSVRTLLRWHVVQ
jgi:hypothetical protein